MPQSYRGAKVPTSSTGLAVAVERDMLAAGPCLQHVLNLVGANSGLSKWIRIQVKPNMLPPCFSNLTGQANSPGDRATKQAWGVDLEFPRSF